MLDELLSFYLYCCLVINSLFISLSSLQTLQGEEQREIVRKERVREVDIQEREKERGGGWY